MNREECVKVIKIDDGTSCTLRMSTYMKYKSSFKLEENLLETIRDEPDKVVRKYLKDKGVTFKGRVTREKLIRSLDELHNTSTGNKE